MVECGDFATPHPGRWPDLSPWERLFWGNSLGKRVKRQIASARKLRRSSTDAELRLWQKLRNRQLNGWKFRRQVPVDRFIADFVCEGARLVVELDGSQHMQHSEDDENRTRVLETCGYEVVRYWNSDVLLNTESVLEDILAALEKR